MGSTLIKQLQVELIILTILIVVTHTIMDVIENIYHDLAQSNSENENAPLNFSFSFYLDRIKSPLPHVLTVILIIMEKVFVLSVMYYLIRNGFTTLNNSIDLLMGGPGSIILVANLLLVVNCSLIFCLLLFLFLWGYDWIRWVSQKVFSTLFHKNINSKILLFASLIFRALNMLALTLVINYLVTYSGKFYTLVESTFIITIILCLWVGIYIAPYLCKLRCKLDSDSGHGGQ